MQMRRQQVLESKLAQKMNHLKNLNFIGRLMRCLQAYKLPVVIPKTKKVHSSINRPFVSFPT